MFSKNYNEISQQTTHHNILCYFCHILMFICDHTFTQIEQKKFNLIKFWMCHTIGSLELMIIGYPINKI